MPALPVVLILGSLTPALAMTTLDDLRWERRLVVAFGDPESAAVDTLRYHLKQMEEQVSERDVDVYLVADESVIPLTSVERALGDDSRATLIGARQSEGAPFEMILIGKDGGRKASSTNPGDVGAFMDKD